MRRERVCETVKRRGERDREREKHIEREGEREWVS